MAHPHVAESVGDVPLPTQPYTPGVPLVITQVLSLGSGTCLWPCQAMLVAMARDQHDVFSPCIGMFK
jgi:hypothetical protein